MRTSELKELYDQGIAYLQNGDYDIASKHFVALMEEDYTPGYNGMGILYLEAKDYEKAEEFFEIAAQRDYAAAYNNLAIIYQDIHEDSEEACEYAKKARELGYNNWANLGMLYGVLGEPEKQEAVLLEGIAENDAFSMMELASVEMDKENFDRAIKLLEYPVSVGIPAAMHNAGLCYERIGDIKNATNYYRTVLEDYMFLPESASRLGYIFAALGEDAKTIQYGRDLLEQAAHAGEADAKVQLAFWAEQGTLQGHYDYNFKIGTDNTSILEEKLDIDTSFLRASKDIDDDDFDDDAFDLEERLRRALSDDDDDWN